MNEINDIALEAHIATQKANEIGLTQWDIASAVGASQSQVSRVLSGQSKRRSRLFDEVCKYVFIYSTRSTNASLSCPELDDAVKAVWDGTPQHAKALALVIRSLAGLHRGEDVSPKAPLQSRRT
jgi:transcriptional regulator with XRE-family HTH domain